MKRYNSNAEEDRRGNFVLYDDAQAELAQLRGNLSLAEEGLANYQHENGQFRKALEMIRDGAIPQAMSPALFAEFILRGPLPQPGEQT